MRSLLLPARAFLLITYALSFMLPSASKATVSTAASDSYEVLSISTPGISSFTFRWSSSVPDVDDVIGIDNLSFNTVTTVPLPAAFWLFG